MKNQLKFVLLTLICGSAIAASPGKLPRTKAVSIMSYNVENLFDTVHDKDREDYTYLPKAVKDSSPEIQAFCNGLSKPHYVRSCLNLDWNEDVLKKKFKNLAKVIKSYNLGMGPDILVLQEVENLNVLKLFIRHELGKIGYKYAALIEGDDKRGIDNGVISKFPIIGSKIHKVDLTGIAKPTRGIMEANILVGGKVITVLGNHWPSQGNPTPARAQAAKTLNKAAKFAKGDVVLALGDFNVVPSRDIPNPIEEIIYPNFRDAEQVARRWGVSLAEGTHWFAGHWDSLDKILVYKFTSPRRARVLYPSVEIVKKDFMLGEKRWTDRNTGEVTIYQGVPYRFDSRTGIGFSDHLPIVVKVLL